MMRNLSGISVCFWSFVEVDQDCQRVVTHLTDASEMHILNENGENIDIVHVRGRS
jgi:hypothetical protein